MKKENRFVKDMTEGTPYKLLLSFAVPLLIGNIFQQLYNMVDSIIVGNFVSPDALGAIGTTGSLHYFFFSLVAGLSVGIGIIVAQFYGAKEEGKVRKIGFSFHDQPAASQLYSLPPSSSSHIPSISFTVRLTPEVT